MIIQVCEGMHDGLIIMVSLILHNNKLYVIQENFFFCFEASYHCPTYKQNKKLLLTCLHLAIGWYKIHPERNYLFSPLTLWSPEYEPIGRPASIILKNLPIMLSGISKIFPIVPKYQPIMLKIMLAYFGYCIICHNIRLPGKFES